MGFGESGEDEEEEDPDYDEEYYGEDGDGPFWSVVGGPEICPVSAVGGG